jgi:hypothetical protein
VPAQHAPELCSHEAARAAKQALSRQAQRPSTGELPIVEPLQPRLGQAYYFAPTVKNGIAGEIQFSYINLPDWAKHYRGH